MGDVITLIFYLLQGDLSIRFIFKVLVILILTGSAFTYYFLALRTTPQQSKHMGIHKIFGSVSAVIVGIALVWGLVIVGSPATGRAHQLDDRRLQDLRSISTEILNIVEPYSASPQSTKPTTLRNPLPQTLKEVSAKAQYQKLSLNDPETGAAYEYTVMSPASFELCATFNFERDLTYDIFWNHPAGRHCFAIDALDTNMR